MPMLKIEGLIHRASEAKTADDAMKFAQAALNAANALCSLRSAEGLRRELDRVASDA